jgi:hypothetical protein
VIAPSSPMATMSVKVPPVSTPRIMRFRLS